MKISRIMMAVTLIFGLSVVAFAQGHSKADEIAGSRIFNANCNRCHPNGGNIIVPNLPLAGSSKLASFKTFLAWIRNPLMPDGSEGAMPAFTKKQISDQQARTLYHYIISMQSPGRQGGYGPGPMGGYGMGPGMMGGYGGRGMMGGYGGYGMGPGMMGGYGAGPGGGNYVSPECRKFLDATAGLRKELSNKRFEYSEAYRNPKKNEETIIELQGEIADLQDKIAEKAPLGCGW